MKINRIALSIISFLWVQITLAEKIVTSAPQDKDDPRYVYSLILLNRALEHTNKDNLPSEIASYEGITSRERSFQLLLDGDIHVVAEAPKPNWESELIAIRIPLRKGIQGYRLFFVHKDHKADLAKVETLEDLQRWSTGSGYQWSTRRVMEENGFDVVVSKSYTGLFSMLNAKRFVTFGRGVNEIFAELEKFGSQMPNAMIDQYVAVYIPLPTYFFVSPKHKALADRIQKGLEIMIDNGEFDQLFFEYHGDMIKQAGLENRKIFKLNNSNLSPASLKLLEEERYWYVP